MPRCHLSFELRTVRRFVCSFLWCFLITLPLLSDDSFVLAEQICFNVAQYPVLKGEIETYAKINKMSFSDAQNAFIEREFFFRYAMNSAVIGFADIKNMASKHLESVMKENRADKKEFSERLRRAPYFTTYEALQREIAYQILMQRLISMQKEKRKISAKELEEERARIPTAKNVEDIEFEFYRRMIWNGIKTNNIVELVRLSANNECR